jgi:hypothetical protein
VSNRHKVTIYLEPRRSSVNIRIRGTGKVLGINLAGFSLSLGNVPIPTTISNKLYLEALMTLCLDAIEAAVL